MHSLPAARRRLIGWLEPFVLALRSRGLALALLVTAAACGGPAGAPQALAAGEWRGFEASWTASGTRSTLDLGPDHQASILHMKGSLLVSGDNQLGVGFRAEIVGFSDTSRGLVGRSVWTDERGDSVFSELKGDFVGSGARLTGTFIGGSGRYAGTTGEYEFQWQYVLAAEDGSVSGRSSAFKGRVRVGGTSGSAPAAPGPVQ